MKPQFQNGTSSRFLDRIKASFSDLRPAEQKLASFLLDFPGDLASYDAQELARLSNVSKATVSRFIRALGYQSYDEARRAVRDEANAGSRLFLGHGDPGAIEDVLSLGIREETENLIWTFQRIDPDALEALAARVLLARKVWVVGHRISHAFASYLRWQLIKVAPDVTLIPKDGETLGEHLAAMSAEDVVIVIALRRRMAGLASLLGTLQNIGIGCALISDDSLPPDQTLGWHFRCRITTATPQFNHAAVLAVCHQIVVRATLRAGREGRARLRRIDEFNEDLGQYD